jgi:hypothetical protein
MRAIYRPSTMSQRVYSQAGELRPPVRTLQQVQNIKAEAPWKFSFLHNISWQIKIITSVGLLYLDCSRYEQIRLSKTKNPQKERLHLTPRANHTAKVVSYPL